MHDFATRSVPRQDIQVLRGIAVLLVVLYHAGLPFLPRGYLGVDVFFVISGYLVTRMVLSRVEAGEFSFGEFYLRRAKRLLPASSCTLLVTSLLSVWFVSQSEVENFIKQLLGAIFFSENLVLLGQSGYFDAAASTKPYLHIWSLSLEEQYYLLLPLLLVLLKRSWRMLGTGVIFVLSIGLCFAWVENAPVATFYLLPTRAWELLLGSLCAIRWGEAEGRIPRPLLVLALIFIVVIPTYPFDAVHPRFDALIIDLSTAALLVGRLKIIEIGPVAGALARIGDWSYSLYLVHWPLFAFAASAYVGRSTPLYVRAAILIAAFPLAYLQYRFVECRFRFTQASAKRFIISAAGICAAAVVVVVAFAFHERTTGQIRDYADVRRINCGMSCECDFSGPFSEKSACMTSTSPEVAIWGDSYAMHLVPGILRSEIGASLVQMTRSACGPILELAILPDSNPPQDTFYRNWAASCIEFNRSVLDYLANKGSIKYVIISSKLELHWTRSRRIQYLSRNRVVDVDESLLLAELASTIDSIRKLGKKVVVVAPPPWPMIEGFDIGACLERLEARKIVLGTESCDFEESRWRNNSQVVPFLSNLERRADVPVLWPSDALCAEDICRASIGGKFIYRDEGHLSVEGSVEFERLFSLGAKVLQNAR